MRAVKISVFVFEGRMGGRTLREKKKIPVASIFFFSNNVSAI